MHFMCKKGFKGKPGGFFFIFCCLSPPSCFWVLALGVRQSRMLWESGRMVLSVWGPRASGMSLTCALLHCVRYGPFLVEERERKSF